MIVIATLFAAMAGTGIMRDPFPDVPATVVASDDFMGGVDGLAALCVADKSAIVIGIGSADWQHGQGSDECEK